MELEVVVVDEDRALCSLGSGQLGSRFVKRLDLEAIRSTISSIFNLLTRATSRGNMNDELLGRLQGLGELLGGQLLPQEIRSQLLMTMGSMVLKVDETLLDVPWELIYDGEQFWGRKFDIGRRVMYSEVVRDRSLPPPHSSPKSILLVVSDPRGDLPEVRREGEILSELLTAKGLSVKLLVNPTGKELAPDLSLYPMVHFAGHAVQTGDGPGWLLRDGPFLFSEFSEVSSLPFFVFSNTCPGSEGAPSHSALAKAILGAGARYFVGTLWDVPDGVGAPFAREFYSFLLSGGTIGAATRYARNKVASEGGAGAVAWSHYVLYGDPAFRMFKPEGDGQTLNFAGRATVPDKPSSEELLRRLRASSTSLNGPQEDRHIPSVPTFWTRAFLLAMALLGIAGLGALALSAYQWTEGEERVARVSTPTVAFGGIQTISTQAEKHAAFLRQCLLDELIRRSVTLTEKGDAEYKLKGEALTLGDHVKVMLILTSGDGRILSTATALLGSDPRQWEAECRRMADRIVSAFR